MQIRSLILNIDFVEKIDSRSGFTEITYNAQDQFKNKRRRTNSIFQIEKHTENKIVKGWNQMINDLTPKINYLSLTPPLNTDKSLDKANGDEETIGYHLSDRPRKSLLDLPQVDMSQIEFRFSPKTFNLPLPNYLTY